MHQWPAGHEELLPTTMPAKDGPLAAKDEGVPANNKALSAIYKALSATDVLGHQAIVEHKTKKMEGLPRVCTHYATPYHLKTSRERHSRIHDHQSRIAMQDGQRSNVCKSMWYECKNKHIKPGALSCVIKSISDRELRDVSSLKVCNVSRFSCSD